MTSKRNLFHGSTSGNTRTHWSPQNITFFLEWFVVEKNLGNWAGKSASTQGYQNIASQFQQTQNITFKRSQLKTKYEALRSVFHMWINMFNGQTGAGFEMATGRMTMDADWWESKIRVNEQYKKFRDDGLDNVELMYNVFGDNNATGSYQFTPTAANPLFNNQFSQVDEFVQENPITSPPSRQTTYVDYEVNSPIKLTEDSVRSRLSGRKISSSCEDTINMRREFALAFMPKEIKIKHEHEPRHQHIKVYESAESTRKALEILYAMQNLDPDVFDVGLTIIKDNNLKNIFINLRNDADRLRWLIKRIPRA